MRLEDYRLVFVAVGLVGVLLLASPALGAVLRFPGGEAFSELYVLGPGHMAENYPYNVVVGQNYSVYVGVGNHLGSSAYYVLYVKLRNQTDLLPNSASGTSSSLQPLYEFRFVVPDGKYWEGPLVFVVSNASISGNQSVVGRLTINNVAFDVDKPAVWDSNSTMFNYQLVFELWLYDAPSSTVQFNKRFVGLQLNLTASI